MNQVGRIKLMTKSLTPDELYGLSKWCTQRARDKARKQSIDEVVNLGVGGRVIYVATNPNYDVAGKTGTIKKITKRKGVPQFTVRFDEDVWSDTRKRITEDYWKWYSSHEDVQGFTKELYEKYVKAGGKGKYWTMRERLRYKEYTRQTGKDPMEEFIASGNVLTHIGFHCLKPITDESIELGRHAREMVPLTKELNKVLKNAFNDVGKNKGDD